ncbi:MAG: hypothetical protein K1X67_15400 [Fimbriimonadaceae bacterium]|nr:hypothetical protein [Fimbriimonadaceae bacterium]
MRAGLAGVLLGLASLGTTQVTSPLAHFGHEVCEDYWLANYAGLADYWKKLEKESPRIRLVSIGKTEEGRDQLMAIISDPRNLKDLEKHRKVNQRLMLAKDIDDQIAAQKLARSAKAIVWIDGGLHATEVLGAQQLIQTAYDLVSREDDENKRILRDCIVLLVHANPDGMDLVSDWYMRRSDPKKRSLEGVPRLYQKYAGHDNNRDFYANNLAETRNMNRIFYSEWFPQIVYNHHQSAPSGTIMFIPPFRNPFNYHVDPITQVGIDTLGLYMHQRLIADGLGGTVMREGANYSGWWNGGLRTTTYFHNMVGILTETWGSPNPTEAPFINNRQIPTIDLPKPVDVRLWHLKDSLRYEISANYAILDYASRFRERLILNAYQSARNGIDRGSKDTWIRYPSRVTKDGKDALSKPEYRDARYYVVPSNQPDFATATKFMKTLKLGGIEIEVLTKDHGKWPAGSYVVRTAQAFRPHILDMFEPQDYPNNFQYPGGPPIPPYDNSGYTPAFTMGVQFDRVLDETKFETRPVAFSEDTAVSFGTGHGPKGAMTEYSRQEARASVFPGSVAWIADGRQNDAFALVAAANALGLRGYRLTADLAAHEMTWPAGSFVVESKGNELALMQRLSSGRFYGLTEMPSGMQPMTMPRIALWDRYSGSMPSGWTRWVFEHFGIPYSVVFAPDLDRGNLHDKYDAILLVSGAVPARDPAAERASTLEDDPTIPFTWRSRIGSVTSKRTLPKLREFVEEGGQLVAIGNSAHNLARHWKLPVESALVDEKGENLPDTQFYIPGSVLRMKTVPGELTLGIPEYVDVMFDESPTFRILDSQRASAVGQFDTAAPLRSGWAWGQAKLKDTVAIVDVPLGKGHVVLVGPEITFRGQTHGTFKLLFNALFRK